MKKILSAVFAVALVVLAANTAFATEASYYEDYDADLIKNGEDNCDYVPNPDQANSDGDREGDLCDNCPDVTNKDQADLDGDGVGDLCDNCPYDLNPYQLDTDENGVGDVCEDVDDSADEFDWSDTDTNTDTDTDDGGFDDFDQEDYDNTVPDLSFLNESYNDDVGCNMVTGATANPIAFALISMALLPLAITRRRDK